MNELQYTLNGTANVVSADQVVDVHDAGGQLTGWAYLSDGYAEPAGTPMAARFVGDECEYTRHESFQGAIDHIRG